jgi:hypothetical protein
MEAEDAIRSKWLEYLTLASEAGERGDLDLVEHYRSVATGLLLALNITKGKK